MVYIYQLRDIDRVSSPKLFNHLKQEMQNQQDKLDQDHKDEDQHYPQDNSYQLGILFKPLHYRYVCMYNLLDKESYHLNPMDKGNHFYKDIGICNLYPSYSNNLQDRSCNYLDYHKDSMMLRRFLLKQSQRLNMYQQDMVQVLCDHLLDKSIPQDKRTNYRAPKCCLELFYCNNIHPYKVNNHQFNSYYNMVRTYLQGIQLVLHFPLGNSIREDMRMG